jgi:hypothetical protein
MKALTLHQPWAALVVQGIKPIENRSWAPPRTVVGKVIAIHAAQGGPGRGEVQDTLRRLRADPRTAPGLADLRPGDVDQRGCIVGLVRVTGWSAVQPADPLGAWWLGPLAWTLTDARRLAQPRPCRGALGLWTVPPHIAAELAAHPPARATWQDPRSGLCGEVGPWGRRG